MNERMRRTYSNTVDIIAFVIFVLKRWFLILPGILAGIAVSIPVMNYTISTEYTCEAKYYLTFSDEGGSYGSLQAVSYIMDDCLAMIKSRTVAKRAIDRNHLDMDEGALLKMVSVSNPNETHILVVSVKSEDEKQAEEVMEALSVQILYYLPSFIDGYSVRVFEDPKTSVNDTTGAKLLTVIIAVIFFFLLTVMIMLLKFMTRPTTDNQQAIAEEFRGIHVYLLPKDGRKRVSRSKKTRSGGVQDSSEAVMEKILFDLPAERAKAGQQSAMILVTSPTGREGASHLANSLVEKLQMEQIKTVLVDDDLRITENSKEGETQKGSLFTMEYNGTLQKRINQLKASYRFIIINASPASETMKSQILAKYTDKNVLVVRYGKTRMYDLRQSVRGFEEKELDVHAIVLNHNKVEKNK